MKKYKKLFVIDPIGKTVFEGTIKKFMDQRDLTFDNYNDFIENLKDAGYTVTNKTQYYDFEYNGEGFSVVWMRDLTDKIGFRYCDEWRKEDFLEAALKLSIKTMPKFKIKFLNSDFLLVVLPKQWDSFIMRIDHSEEDKEVDIWTGKLTYKVITSVKEHLENSKINRTGIPKIKCMGFINDWRNKIKYADYNEGYTMYYNNIPDTKILEQLYK